MEVKEKAEALRALVEGSFKRRFELETLEWKTNFSLWTGLILAGWALHNKPETQHLHCWSMFFLLVIPIQFYFVHSFARSEQKAVRFAFAYLQELENLIGLVQRGPFNLVEYTHRVSRSRQREQREPTPMATNCLRRCDKPAPCPSVRECVVRIVSHGAPGIRSRLTRCN